MTAEERCTCDRRLARGMVAFPADGQEHLGARHVIIFLQ